MAPAQSSYAGGSGDAPILPGSTQSAAPKCEDESCEPTEAALARRGQNMTKAANPALQYRQVSQSESAVNTWPRADTTTPSVSSNSKGSQAAGGAIEEWHGFAADDDVEAGVSGSGVGMTEPAVDSSGSKGDAASQPSGVPRDQNAQASFAGFDVVDGKKTPDPIPLSYGDRTAAANGVAGQRSAERTRSAIFSRGPSEDIPSSKGGAGDNGVAAGSGHRATKQQRAQPHGGSLMQPTMLSPKVSGISADILVALSLQG